MRLVDLSMTVDECDSAPFAPEENYFKLRPIIKWEEKGFVSNVVQMTVHVGTHIDSGIPKERRRAWRTDLHGRTLLATRRLG